MKNNPLKILNYYWMHALNVTLQKLLNEDDISIIAYMSNNPEKPLLRYAIDVLNINIYKILAHNKRINSNNEEFEINGKTNLHYICEMKFDKSKEDKHLELIKHIYNKIARETFPNRDNEDGILPDPYRLIKAFYHDQIFHNSDNEIEE